ncbi:MAG: glycerophosphodiester phosphodiesterase [Halobacteriales archaeon]
MELIAHRGCADQYPENTIYAVKQAAPHVDAIEVDVRRCGSGELVVFHDAELERLTGQHGLVAETPWSELRTCRIEGTAHGIPQLSELIRAIPPDVGLDLELKVSGLVEDVLEVIEQTDHEFALTANQAAVAEAIVDHSSGPAGGFIFWEHPWRGLEAVRRVGCELIVPEASLCLGTELIETAQTYGFDVWVWTVDDRETARRLQEAGADGLIVDRWDIL